MSETVLASILVAIITAASSAGFWTYRASRRAEPVTQRTADLAVAQTSPTMALDVAKSAQAYSAEVATALKETKADLERLTGRFTALETELRERDKTIRRQRHHLHIFSEAWDDLTTGWPVLRMQEQAPPKPHLPTSD